MLNRQKADGNRRPLLLVGEERGALWGGSRISSVIGGEKRQIAELWALSVRDDVNTKIADSDQTLADYIREEGGDTVAPAYRAGDPFPLLLKILDADLPLSVQVHPDRAYAENHGGASKNEMWYILHAEEGAEILYGMKDGLTAADFALLVNEGKTLDGVNVCRIEKNEHYYIPAGLLHALGGGITVAEVQENSDTTYRLYDYDRVDKNGCKRELHLDHALAVLRPYGEEELTLARYDASVDAPTASTLADNDRFRTRAVCEEESFSDSADAYFRAVFALTDTVIVYGEGDLHVPAYRAAFLPAGMGAYTVKGSALVVDADRFFQNETNDE